MTNAHEFAFGYNPIDSESFAELPLLGAVGGSLLVMSILAVRTFRHASRKRRRDL
jgi:hypothetical protein